MSRPAHKLAPRTVLATLALATLALLLTACPGPGPSVLQPRIEVLNPTDDQVISGERTINVSARLVNMPNVASYTVTLNDEAQVATLFDGVISAQVELRDHQNTVGFEATSSSGDTVEADVTVDYPFVTLLTYQAAAIAIGQPDLTSVTEAEPRKRTAGPSGRPSVVDGHLFLPDEDLNRVLGYGAVPTASDASPDFVLGQEQFDDTSGREGASGLHMPGGTATDGVRLAVADANNSRVLVWNSAPTATAAPADLVLGQPDFLTNTPSCSATGLDHPGGVAFVGDKLVVADTTNNRVLVWSLSATNGAAAEVVIGQDDFTSCTNNDDDQDGTADASPSARTLSAPLDVWSDGQRLYIADTFNNRVLAYDALPTQDFAPASLVLGQTGFASNAADTTATSLSGPSSVHGNANQLFVADTGNNRVLVWQSVPSTNGQPADLVLGQTSFTDSTANAGQLEPHENGMGTPTGVYQTGDVLIVGDYLNERYLVFRGTAVP